MDDADPGLASDEARAVLFGVLVTFRRPDTLRTTLRSLADQSRTLDLLLVVDNEPLDANASAVAEYQETGLRAEYLPMEENLGPAGGYAVGIGAALEQAEGPGSWVVLVDDDDPPWSDTIIEDMERFAVDTIRRDAATGAVGSVGSRFDLRRGRADRLRDEELTGAVRVDSIGNNVWPFYSADALRRAGPFEPRLFFGFEELELGLRLERSGYHLYCNGPLMLESRRHFGRLALEVRPRLRRGPPAWRRYYSIRNLIWMLRSNGSLEGAARVTITVGIAKPLVGLITFAPDSPTHARLALKACRDGWSGRLGRRVEPPHDYHPKNIARQPAESAER